MQRLWFTCGSCQTILENFFIIHRLSYPLWRRVRGGVAGVVAATIAEDPGESAADPPGDPEAGDEAGASGSGFSTAEGRDGAARGSTEDLGIAASQGAEGVAPDSGPGGRVRATSPAAVGSWEHALVGLCGRRA